ncbi:MAG: elongation factor P [Christensenellaceae bacterium]|jgi:elongation factor P|nr:elongation factor P [Christensenellaceae bacterium]
MEAKDLRPGKFFRMNGIIYEVVDYEFRQQPRLAASVKAKIRNIKSGAISEENFKGNPYMEDVLTEWIDMQYSYNDGELYYFMNPETYDTVPVNKALAEGAIKFNPAEGEGIVCKFAYADGEILNVIPPTIVTLTVVDTEPSVAGDTARNAMKNATLDSGITIKVPMFVNNGDKINVDTRTSEYKDRA